MGFELYQKAVAKTNEEQVWEQWLVDYSQMDEKTFIPFSDYLKRLKQPMREDKRTDEEIIEDAEQILNMFKRSE
jgi:hypothetical protein